MIVVLSFAITTCIFAQEKNKDSKMSSSKMNKMHDKMQDCVVMENGKMMVMKGGKTMGMDQDMTLKNGSTVMTDGTIKMKNGETKMLKDGQCVYMNGKMGMMKMEKMKSDKMKSGKKG